MGSHAQRLLWRGCPILIDARVTDMDHSASSHAAKNKKHIK